MQASDELNGNAVPNRRAASRSGGGRAVEECCAVKSDREFVCVVLGRVVAQPNSRPSPTEVWRTSSLCFPQKKKEKSSLAAWDGWDPLFLLGPGAPPTSAAAAASIHPCAAPAPALVPSEAIKLRCAVAGWNS